MFSASFLLLCLLFALNAFSATVWSPGDVLVARTDGTVQVRSANGILKTTLNPGSAGAAKGLLLDSFGNLLVSHWFVPDLSGGNNVDVFHADGTYAGIFGPGHLNCQPSGMALGPNGNVYIAYADCDSHILRFDAAGNILQIFTVSFENFGPRWIDLAPDGCTLYYTSLGHYVSRFNVCTNTQLPNFNATALPSNAGAVGVRVLPNGAGVIVADSEVIYRLDSTGQIAATYDAVGDDYLASIFLDADGKSFWSSSYGTSNVYKFDILTGAVLMNFYVGAPGTLAKAVIVIPPAPETVTPPPTPFAPVPPLNSPPLQPVTPPPPAPPATPPPAPPVTPPSVPPVTPPSVPPVTPPSAAGQGRMTGGGNFFTQSGIKVTHGFELRCNVNDPRQNLEVNWDRGQQFHLESVTSVYCYDDPAINPENPDAPIDTLILTGTGRLHGNQTGTITLKFTDAGEPGVGRDGVAMTIKDSSGNVVLEVAPTVLSGGNHQAHRETGNAF